LALQYQILLILATHYFLLCRKFCNHHSWQRRENHLSKCMSKMSPSVKKRWKKTKGVFLTQTGDIPGLKPRFAFARSFPDTLRSRFVCPEIRGFTPICPTSTVENDRLLRAEARGFNPKSRIKKEHPYDAPLFCSFIHCYI